MKNFAFNFCIICMILVLGHACDPDTQYEKDGVCCKMCGPGTRMNIQGSCEDPVCIPCGKNEYQSGYTEKTKCDLQPYCDPNLNLVQGPLDPKTMVPCMCKHLHHCSSEECLTCVANRVCEPGTGVIKMATGHSDTVCEACRQGTFSNESSPVQECRPWTKCDGKTPREKKSGTPTSDVECEETSSNMAVTVIFLILAVLILVAALIFFIKMKGLEKLKKCLKKAPGEEDHERNIQPLIVVEEGLIPEKLIQNPTEPEDATSDGWVGELGPEENEETQPQVPGVTDNNMPMRQEEGKEEHTSQPETDCLDHSCFTDIHFVADSSS